MHDGYLWLEETIPITPNLIHHVSRLPYKGKDLATISEGKGSDLAFAEAMKPKYKLEKKKRGYAISIIKDKEVHMATQIMAGKVMRKCHADEVLVLVVTLASWTLVSNLWIHTSTGKSVRMASSGTLQQVSSTTCTNC